MSILITGGSGFIGSHITDRLLINNNKVVVIDNYETGRRDNLKEQENLTIIEGSIVNNKLLEDIFNKHNIVTVIHTAASYKDPNNWVEDARTNIEGTINVVQLSLKHKVKRFIYFQTALCYGTKPLEIPITLDHPILPEGSSYSISKTAGEQYIHLSGLNYVTFRLANVYGPRNVSGPLPTFYQRIHENKSCFVVNTKRDFVFVDDLVDVCIKAINGEGNGTYHVSSGNDISIKELWDATLKALNIKYDVEEKVRHKDDAPTILLDPKKTNDTFNWIAKTKLEDGVEKAIDYYKKNGINETFTHLTSHD